MAAGVADKASDAGMSKEESELSKVYRSGNSAYYMDLKNPLRF